SCIKLKCGKCGVATENACGERTTNIGNALLRAKNATSVPITITPETFSNRVAYGKRGGRLIACRAIHLQERIPGGADVPSWLHQALGRRKGRRKKTLRHHDSRLRLCHAGVDRLRCSYRRFTTGRTGCLDARCRHYALEMAALPS